MSGKQVSLVSRSSESNRCQTSYTALQASTVTVLSQQHKGSAGLDNTLQGYGQVQAGEALFQYLLCFPTRGSFPSQRLVGVVILLVQVLPVGELEI